MSNLPPRRLSDRRWILEYLLTACSVLLLGSLALSQGNAPMARLISGPIHLSSPQPGLPLLNPPIPDPQ